MDPLEFFPPEISLQCILDILPPRSHDHSHTILELASVARRWQEFIVSAPSLWVEINVEHTINDLHAIVSVFLTFSRALSLKIVIWEDGGESWKDVCSLLLPHAARISTLVYVYKTSLHRLSSISILSKVISSLGQPPNLKEIDFGTNIYTDGSELDSIGLQPETRITSRAYPRVMDIGAEKDLLSHLTNLATLYAIEQIIPVLPWLPNLTEIRFDAKIHYEHHGLQILDEIPLQLSLKTLSSEHSYSASLDRVIHNSASQLCSLSAFIRSEAELAMLLATLGSLSKLQELHLDIFPTSSRSEVGPHPEYGHAIHSLHTLSVRTEEQWSELALDINLLFKLFNSLEVIYPHVKKVTLEGTIGVLKVARRYLQGLQSIQSLHLETSEVKVPETSEIRIELPSLHGLRASSSDLQRYLEVPNLLHLVVWQVQTSAQLSELSFLQLRRLEVQTLPSSEISTLILDPTKYPALCELKIQMHGPLVLWELTSFPNLTSIHLSSIGRMLIHPNRLFIMLIYDPKICPLLQHIRLADFVEWDLLFLMLQRRNFGNTGVKPISELIIPFVPLEFRTNLQLLLEGKSSTMPEDLDLSMVTTRKIICDATIRGCVLCLKYMRPYCSSAVKEFRSSPGPLALHEPKYPEPPGTLPVEIRELLARHHELMEEWRICFAEFQSKFYRATMCGRA